MWQPTVLQVPQVLLMVPQVLLMVLQVLLMVVPIWVLQAEQLQVDMVHLVVLVRRWYITAPAVEPRL